MALQGFRKWIIVAVAISAAIMELIDTSIVNVGLLQMAGSLGVNVEDVAWVITAYAIANVIIIPLTGFFQRYFGRKNYFIFSIILFTLASYFCGMATTLPMLVLARFIQGIGGGALLSVSQGLLFDSFTPQQRPIASAVFGMGIVLGPTFGPTLGGYIIDNYHWSWMFFINIPVGILAVALSYSFIETKPEELNIDRKAIKVDYFGIVLLAVGIGCLQFVLERGEADDWFDSNLISICTVATIICLLGFGWWELRIAEPVVNLRIFRNRNLSLGTALMFVIGIGLFTSVYMYPLFVQRIVGYTATQTGRLLIPGSIISVFLFPLAGRLLAKGVAPARLIMIGYAAFALFCYVLSTYNANASAGMFIFALMIRGLGLAFANVPLINQSVATLAPKDLPMGIAITNMVRQVGGAFGIALTNTYIGQRLPQHVNDLSTHLQAGDALTTERITNTSQALIARGINPLDVLSITYQNLQFTIQKQALMLSYLDVFRAAMVFFLITFPLAFFLQNKKPNAAAVKAAAEAH